MEIKEARTRTQNQKNEANSKAFCKKIKRKREKNYEYNRDILFISMQK